MPFTDTGILMDAKYKATQAQTILELLHDFPDAERKGPETFRMLAKYLQSDNLAIAELSWYHLQRLAPKVRLPSFNAADPLDERKRIAEEIRKMIPDKLPPREKPVEPMSPKKEP